MRIRGAARIAAAILAMGGIHRDARRKTLYR
jgi:hypothetical protein